METEAPTVGRYQIEGEMGRGGMGTVYRGHDPAFHRTLAVKVLRQEYRGRADLQRRFLEEAQLTGQLQHPGIPPVHELGTLPDGRPFFSMKLIKGQTLAELLKQRAGPPEDLPRFLAIFEQVCQTLAYVHSRGVIHRDLKPSNIMVGAFGEVQVMDWGLAKVLGAASGWGQPLEEIDSSSIATVRTMEVGASSQIGVILGTPSYMAPEQARGEVDQLDKRCDVFGLGAILCIILTGKHPYPGPAKDDLYRQAAQADLADARARLEACGADAELVRLAKACLGPKREDRPHDAGQVAQAVAACQAAVQERLQQAERERAAAQVKAAEERKRRKLTAALALAGLLVVSLAGVGAWWYQREQGARETELAARRAATERDVTAALKEVEALNKQGWQQWKENNDPDRWGDTLHVAMSALQRAKGLLNSGEPTDELRQQVEAVRAKLEEVEAHQLLAVALDCLRLELTATKSGHLRNPEVGSQFGALFRKHDLDVLGSDLDTLARRLQQHRLRDRLLIALEEWAILTSKAAERQRLTAVLRAADPDADSFRNHWREAMLRRDKEALVTLAGQAKVAKLPAPVLRNLSVGLVCVGADEAAVRLLRKGQARHPDDFALNHELGLTLANMQPARLDEAIPFLTAAVALRKRNALAHYNLGLALDLKGDLDGAIRSYRAALERDAKYVPAHNNLGAALKRKGDIQGAIRAYRTALDLDPKDFKAHYNLGRALYAREDLDGAIRCYRTALDINPKFALAHANLGFALHAKGNLKGAIWCYRAALEVNPKFVLAQLALGQALLQQGRFPEARQETQRALELLPARNPQRDLATRQLRQCEQLLALDEKLPAMLKGEVKPADAAECLAVARLCQYKELFAASVRFYTGAFAEQPELANDLRKQARYNAACAAALAAAGKGKDADKLDDKERTRLRKKALDWVRADLAMWGKLLEKTTPQQRAAVHKIFTHWKRDADLATVRDKEALAKLPEAEREAWQKLWADVDAVLGKLANGPASA
jgi:serine/threonine-protein kinase